MPMPRTRNEWVTALLVGASLAPPVPLALAAQGTPLEAFRSNIAAIHARNRAAYLSHYLHSPELARVGPDGLRQGYDEFARADGAAWPDTLVATHLRIVPLSPDVAYGVYRYRVVDSGASVRGVSERVFVRTAQGWKVAVTTAFPTPDAAPPNLALVGATLVDGTGASPVRDAVVVMRESRIACAGPRAACPLPPDADTVDATGKWIIPGLIDAHVHFSQTGWVDGRPDTGRMSALVHAAGDEARRVGLPFIVHATGLWEAKDALRAGAGMLVHSVYAEPVDDEFLALARRQRTIYVPTLTVLDGYQQVRARRFDRERQPLGCVDPGTRAKAFATDTVALALRPPSPAAEERSARTQRLMAQGRANLKRVHDAGIPVALGTDAGNPLTLHGASVPMELEAMQAAGLTPLDVLVAATRNGARALGLGERDGTVTAGATADLVVLDADPLADIRNVRRVALVVRRGEIYTRRELEYP